MTPVDEEYARRCGVWSDLADHLPYLHAEVLTRDAGIVVELGVRSGNSTVAFLAALEHTGGLLFSVDLAEPDWPQFIWTHPQSVFLLGDDLTLAPELPEHIDVLFIDTSHHYQHTLAELRLYGPRADVILMHDTDLEHPYMAPPGDPPFPVRCAINVYCEETGRKATFHPGSYGLGEIV